ncbi:DUF6907 domain-containing protein [Streptomyces sp. NPDC050516]|uniref:DUF6907 domain-containing protein n=1 Tax=Streptomyces sp. NPDC050516 TaxID=3365621 RepID=UPI0037B3A7FF
MSGDGGNDPLEGVDPEVLAWHWGALANDPAVCCEPQPGQDGYPCILNRAYHFEHRDVLGRTWPREEPLYVARMAPVVDGQVTVETRDYGPVTTPEPSWCNGRHRQGGMRADIGHQAEDVSCVFSVDQAAGPAEFLTSFLTQRPFSPTDTGLYLAVELGDQNVELDPAGVDALAVALVGHASVLRSAARRLAVMRGEA